MTHSHTHQTHINSWIIQTNRLAFWFAFQSDAHVIERRCKKREEKQKVSINTKSIWLTIWLQ